jgi:hypothetical protein
MAYKVWPATLPDPDSPMKYDRNLPIELAQTNDLGKFTSKRIQTRTSFKSTATMLLEPNLFQTFLAFWVTTLSNGKAIFTAPWIATLAHPEYVARILSFSVGAEGVAPIVTMQLELVPDVKLDPTNTFPDPWPNPT